MSILFNTIASKHKRFFFSNLSQRKTRSLCRSGDMGFTKWWTKACPGRRKDFRLSPTRSLRSFWGPPNGMHPGERRTPSSLAHRRRTRDTFRAKRQANLPKYPRWGASHRGNWTSARAGGGTVRHLGCDARAHPVQFFSTPGGGSSKLLGPPYAPPFGRWCGYTAAPVGWRHSRVETLPSPARLLERQC